MLKSRTRLIIPLAAASLMFLACDRKDVRVDLPEGTLRIEPVAEDAIRVRLVPEGAPELEELIFTEEARKPSFKVRKSDGNIQVVTARMSAEYRGNDGSIVFKDAQGKILLEEKAGGRSVDQTVVNGTPAFEVSQRFVSPSDEHLYGTGQFQDGNLDIRGLSRRLTQVNSQISIPMVISNKGYGILWHNYGLTEFNPCDHSIALEPYKRGISSDKVNVTGTSGNLLEIRQYDSFIARITLEEDADYSFLLDVGSQEALPRSGRRGIGRFLQFLASPDCSS